MRDSASERDFFDSSDENEIKFSDLDKSATEKEFYQKQEHDVEEEQAEEAAADTDSEREFYAQNEALDSEREFYSTNNRENDILADVVDSVSAKTTPVSLPKKQYVPTLEEAYEFEMD